ncbi:phosphodiester glycosidase family protein [Bacillota bacterium LX-D]|nr:phosphodiester glycosidase family protein [Bacillota bacterium LX-D]
MVKKHSRKFLFMLLSTLVCMFLAVTAAWADYSQLQPKLKQSGTKTLAPGVVYTTYIGSTAAGSPLRVYVLKADLTKDNIEVQPVLAAGGKGSVEKVSSMAKRTGAVGAINGGFFSMSSPHNPVGNLIINGKTVASSDILRASLGIFNDKTVKVGCYQAGSTDAYWQGLKHLITAGPLLVEEGQPVLEAVAEGFTGGVLERAPRTALGVTRDQQMLLLVVDGRQSGRSAGLNLEELACLMADLGAQEAIGLDGGGSSEMVVNNQVVNKPSDGRERSVNNGIVILASIPVYLDGARIDFDVPPQMKQGRVLVPFRGILEAIGAQVEYDAASKSITARKDGKVVQFTIGASTALIDGQEVSLDVPAQEVGGRTLVPIRFISSALGKEVNWTDKNAVEIK